MQIAVAQALLEIDAIRFTPQQPITFTSGIKSPVYIDNRKLIYHPRQWRTVINGFYQLIKQKKLLFDLIAGIETSGIPHSSVLSLRLKKPSVFIRKKVEDHGTKIPIEGGQVNGKKVLLLEDHVSVGTTSLHGVQVLRDNDATVKHCLSITSYNFPVTKKAFKKAKVRLYTLTTFPVILRQAIKQKLFSLADKKLITRWLNDPYHWP